MHCTSKLSTSHTSMLSSWNTKETKAWTCVWFMLMLPSYVYEWRCDDVIGWNRSAWNDTESCDLQRTTGEDSVQDVFRCCGLTFEMKGMCILVYGLMSLISTWVLMFLSSSETQHHMISSTGWRLPSTGLMHALTLYVLSNEGVVHYVTVICFQDFLKFSDVIVLVGAGRTNIHSCYMVYIVSEWPTEKPSSWSLSNTFHTLWLSCKHYSYHSFLFMQYKS